MEIRFAQAARRHRIGRASVRFVGAYRPRRRSQPLRAARRGCVGSDERDRELEVVAGQAQSDRDPEPVLLVIHVMPTHYRRKDSQ